MLLGSHALKKSYSENGVSPIILNITYYNNQFDPSVDIVVSGFQPINWFDSATNYGGTIANNTSLNISNPGYGWYNHCVTFTNSYGTTGTSFSLSSSDPSP
jgi:hypothetical protein